MKNHPTILALDPGLRDLGYAVLCGRRLIDSGVQSFRFVPPRSRHSASLRAIKERIDRHRVTAIVLEATPGDHEQNFAALRRLERSIRRLAARRRLRLAVYPAQAVRKGLLGDGWADKYEVAGAVAARYPTLRIFVRQDRRWKERYFQNMFDALALGLHHESQAM